MDLFPIIIIILTLVIYHTYSVKLWNDALKNSSIEQIGSVIHNTVSGVLSDHNITDMDSMETHVKGMLSSRGITPTIDGIKEHVSKQMKSNNIPQSIDGIKGHVNQLMTSKGIPISIDEAKSKAAESLKNKALEYLDGSEKTSPALAKPAPAPSPALAKPSQATSKPVTAKPSTTPAKPEISPKLGTREWIEMFELKKKEGLEKKSLSSLPDSAGSLLDKLTKSELLKLKEGGLPAIDVLKTLSTAQLKQLKGIDKNPFINTAYEEKYDQILLNITESSVNAMEANKEAINILSQLKDKATTGGGEIHDGGGLVSDMKGYVKNSLPKSPLLLFKYWSKILGILVLIVIIATILIRYYVEEYAPDDVTTKLNASSTMRERIQDYILNYSYLLSLTPLLLYCIVRFVFDLLYYDAWLIPALGEIIEIIERIPIIWPIIFGVSLSMNIYKILSDAAEDYDISCPPDMKPKKRCFPGLLITECPDKEWSWKCWFKY